MLQWSFVRDDQPRSETCAQIALAHPRRGARPRGAPASAVIQIDEPALREGLPLRSADQADYLALGDACFRLTVGAAAPTRRRSTPTCAIRSSTRSSRRSRALDADVISIEASRSDMELLDAFRDFDYPGEIGPGVYDIHSPRVPAASELERCSSSPSGASGAGPAMGQPGLRAEDPRLDGDPGRAREHGRGGAPSPRRERGDAGMSALLDRLPALTTTGDRQPPVRPRRRPRPARAAAYDLPFCPQLPRVHGDMIAEWLGSDPGRCGWAPDRDRERPVCLARVRRAAHRPTARRTALVKLQVTGPITLAIALQRHRQAWPRPRVVALARDVATWLAANTAGQVRRLAQVGLDAPVSSTSPASRAPGSAAEPRSGTRCGCSSRWGMHVCGPVPWELVDASSSTCSRSTSRPTASPRRRPVLGGPCAAAAVSRGACSTPSGPARPGSRRTGCRGAVGVLRRALAPSAWRARPAHAHLRHRPALVRARAARRRTLGAAAQAVRGAVAARPHRYRTAQQTADVLRRQKHSTSANPARRSAASSSSSGK